MVKNHIPRRNKMEASLNRFACDWKKENQTNTVEERNKEYWSNNENRKKQSEIFKKVRKSANFEEKRELGYIKYLKNKRDEK